VTPTQRTLKKLRDAGYVAEVVERWNPHAKVRHDLFGGIDVLAVGFGVTYAIQCTTQPNAKRRVEKLKALPALPFLVAAGWRIEVWGWAKKKGEKQWLPHATVIA